MPCSYCCSLPPPLVFAITLFFILIFNLYYRPQSWPSPASPFPSLFSFLSQQSAVIVIILPITLIEGIITERPPLTTGCFRFKVAPTDHIHVSASFAMFNQCATCTCSSVINGVKSCSYVVSPLLSLPLRSKTPRKPSCFSICISDTYRSDEIFCTSSGTPSYTSCTLSHCFLLSS